MELKGRWWRKERSSFGERMALKLHGFYLSSQTARKLFFSNKESKREQTAKIDEGRSCVFSWKATSWKAPGHRLSLSAASQTSVGYLDWPLTPSSSAEKKTHRWREKIWVSICKIVCVVLERTAYNPIMSTPMSKAHKGIVTTSRNATNLLK